MKHTITILSIICLIASCSSSKQEDLKNGEIKLNFKSFDKLSYQFNQSSKSTQSMFTEANELPDTNKALISGLITLETQNDSTASLGFINLVSKSLNFGKNDTSIMEFPTQLLQGFNQYGENQINSAYNYKFLAMFPLPYRVKSHSNYTFKVPTSMPFNANGSALTVKGENIITITDTVEFNNIKCLKITCQTNLDKLDIPEELKGIYICKLYSTFNGLFDYKNGYFISGHAKADTYIKMETVLANSQDTTKMEMTSNEEFNYSLIKN